MTIVHTLDIVSEWLRANVCQRVQYKPHSLDQQTDQYEYELVHPNVFTLYVPTSSTKPPAVKATSPSICVQMVEGVDRNRAREMQLRLSFSVWNPGIHGPDILYPLDKIPKDPDTFTSQTLDVETGQVKPPDPLPPEPENVYWPDFGKAYERGPDGMVRLTHDGWRDVWNFVDAAIREIENARSVAGLLIGPDIRFGPYDEQGVIADYAPFWFAWIELTLHEQLTPDNPAINDLL